MIWVFFPHLKEFSARTMKFNTTVGMMLSSCALWLLQGQETDRLFQRKNRIALGLASVVFMIGLFTVLEYFFNTNLGIDEFFISDFPNPESVLYPGRMSPIAATCFMALSISFFLVNLKRGRHFHPITFFSKGLFFVCLFSLIGYFYGEASFYQFGPYIRIAWQSSFCFIFLALGVFHTRPENGISPTLASTGLGGVMFRRLVPFILVTPVVLGYVWLEARRSEVVSRELGITLFVVAIISILLFVVSHISRRLDILESEMKLRTVADTLPQIMWTAKANGELDYANARWYEYTGLTSDKTLGFGFSQAIHPDDREASIGSYSNAVKNGVPLEASHRFRDRDGNYRWFLVRAVPYRENGKITSWYGTCTDIDAQKQIEKDLAESALLAKNASETKSAFLANMSHEIRTPLGAILGFTELLRDQNLSDQERTQFLNTISRNGKALTRIIDDILDLSKVEAGKLTVENSTFSIIKLVEEIKELFSDQAESKKIFIEIHAADIPKLISADPARLRQILINIIGNAVKFTFEGGINIFIRSDLIKNRYQFEIDIVDTGIGISPDLMERLFQPFSQADNSTTRKFGGTGLGLVLSRRLAQALGGNIVVRPNHPHGSIFTISFSAFPASSVSDTSSLESEHATYSGKKNISILLADDSADNRMLIKTILNQRGYSVITAEDGESAFETAINNHFDIVLMDIQMPKMDGYTATQKLRKAGYRGPIIALTAHAMAEDRIRTINAGCDGHLTKPINFDELISVIEDKTAAAQTLSSGPTPSNPN
jgi:two-component system, sensor histidine kinase